MSNQKSFKISLYILFIMGFSFISSNAQSTVYKSDLSASVKNNDVNLEWTAPKNEEFKSFNIYRAMISEKSKDINPSNLSFEMIGSTKDQIYVDELEKIKSAKGRDFCYYIAIVGKDGKENGKSNVAFAEANNGLPSSANIK